MLLDTFAPKPDASERHEIEIAAPPDVVYRALWTVDFAKSPVVRALLFARSLPALIRKGTARPPARELRLKTIVDAGFGRLAENPGHELVLGVSGRFWRPIGNLEPFSRAAFSAPVPGDVAQAVWNFSVRPSGDRSTLLSTETRITCGAPASRIKFRLYWLVVRPFSGLIRIIVLRAVRSAAEGRDA